MIIVYESASLGFLGRQVFQADVAARYPGASAIVQLYRVAEQNGHRMMTAEDYLATPLIGPASCLAEMVTPRTLELLRRGVRGQLLFSGESPNVAWSFYRGLARISRRFEYTSLFRGASERVDPATKFHPFFWPTERQEVIAGPEWSGRELLVMVASNKDRWSVGGPPRLRRLKRLAKRFGWSALQVIDPFFRFPDLYNVRLAAIRHFAPHPDFRLYGVGWDRPGTLSRKDLQAVRRARATPVDDKLVTITNFRYSLCFENCVFPGYVTEKIFDCLFAGTVPIYLGAPDITDFVPAETFIDFRRFQDFAELASFLREAGPLDWQRWRNAAEDYLHSESFRRFHQDSFVDQTLSLLVS